MSNNRAQKPRIVLCGIGQFGSIVAQIAAEKDYPIVAAFNREGEKVGKDLGQVAGLNRDLGVIVQDINASNLTDLQADIAIVTQTNVLSVNLPIYKKLISAGINVLCLGTESYFPYSCNHAVATEIDQLAKANGVTFTGTGIWDMSRIWSAIVAAGPCTEITSFYHSSLTNVADQLDNAPQAEKVLGIGLTVDEFIAQGFDSANPVAMSYRTICEMVVSGLGYSILRSNAWVEPAVLEQDLDSPLMGRVIPAGGCVGSIIRSELETREGVTARAEIQLRLAHPEEIENTYWEINGKPGNKVRINRADSRHASPAILFNRIPDVLAAPPGIVTIIDMGPVKHSALV